MNYRAIGLTVGWLLAASLCAVHEFARAVEAARSPAGVLGWFANWNLDTTVPFCVLITLPALFACRRFQNIRSRSNRAKTYARGTPPSPESATGPSPSCWRATLAVIFLSLVSSAAIGARSIEYAVPQASPSGSRLEVSRFALLPPAYHDEFSYLLQARTFLAGRLSWPPPPVAADLFHQIHVLSAPVIASRYFPWTGVWLIPFVACHVPWLGHWIAGALAAGCGHRILLRCGSPRAALAGGTLLSVCPGLAVFSNLLLSHHPTMLALMVFFLSLLRLQETGQKRFAWLAGGSLALGMLGRPLTAAAFALPFGLHFVWCWRYSRQAFAAGGLCFATLRTFAGLVLPLIAGMCSLAVMNEQITGDWRLTPYQLYTETWTPRHRFGFGNAAEGSEALRRSNVLEKYDQWAANLTPELAFRNVINRAVASGQWTLGVPVLLCLIPAAVTCANAPRTGMLVKLLLASIVLLHAVHVPYWFDGILHWHYVFETAPLIVLLATIGAVTAWQSLQDRLGSRTSLIWVAALLISGLAPSWIDASGLWGPSRVSLAVGEQAYSRVRMAQFRSLVADTTVKKPCLILVDERAADPQLSFIVNPPDLKSDALIARMPASPPATQSDQAMWNALRKTWPDRAFYRFDPQRFQLTGLTVPDMTSHVE